jgi:hypothetical protein
MNAPRAVLLALALLAAPAHADDPDEIRIALPDVPELGAATDGVQRVQGIDLEVFFTAGQYWVKQDQGWFSARQPGEPFVQADRRRVPQQLSALRPDPVEPAAAAAAPAPAAPAPQAAPPPAPAKAEPKAAPKAAPATAPAKPAAKPAAPKAAPVKAAPAAPAKKADPKKPEPAPAPKK